MRYATSRKYPITHMKKNAGPEERYLDLSVAAAAGLLAFVFAKGVFWGYMIRKWKK
jgi:hypothetical protein